MIESLYHPTESFFVGIAEIRNEHNLSMKEILKLAQKNPDNIMAVQFLNSSLIAGTLHLVSAAQNALNAWLGQYAISRSLDVEIILYSSAQRQISVALDQFGLKDRLDTVALVLIGTEKKEIQTFLDRFEEQIGPFVFPPFASSKERMDSIMEHFDISVLEITALTSKSDIESRWIALSKCVASRVSLVAVDS
ncbi:MAG: hypothetical protein GF411_17255 [Candidatus Lokiarchaeota archaeon]|nr:hypothetical protein [Candidatus Lokiarchaeota archaeon]